MDELQALADFFLEAYVILSENFFVINGSFIGGYLLTASSGVIVTPLFSRLTFRLDAWTMAKLE